RVWEASVPGEVWRMVPGNDRLFVVTMDGHLHSFGKETAELKTFAAAPTSGEAPSDSNPAAQSLLADAGTREGYALVLGLEDGVLTEALARNSKFHIVVIDPDKDRVNGFRKRMVEADLYGDRV